MQISNMFSPGWTSVLARLSPRQELLTAVRNQWGKPGAAMRWRASGHFDLVRHQQSGARVDDTTWLDLEFPRIFARLDTSVTPLGSQCLFTAMRTYVDEPHGLAARYARAHALRMDATLREALQLALGALRDDGHADIVDVAFGDTPRSVKYPWLLLAWSALSLVAVSGAVASLWPVWCAFAAIAINVAVLARLFWGIQRGATALKRCLGMLPVADALARIPVGNPPFDAMEKLREQAPLRRQVLKKLRWLALMQKDAVQLVSVWLNIAFLAELVAYAHALKHFAAIRPVLQSTFELLGSIDADIAVASWLEGHPDHCAPEVSGVHLIDIRGGRHPLLADPVPNALHLDGRSALIAGSNMAGKTTMVKMIGINIILARTLGFCMASRAIIPRSSVMTSIRSEHSVESGKSHYFGEIERLQCFIECASRGDCAVFIVDELFNGTNTVERIAIARAVLERLSRHAQVLVTTHDVELQQYLAGNFDLYHFQESPDIEGFFDYRMRSGAAVERNAIRLLGRVGFPADVVARALVLAG